MINKINENIKMGKYTKEILTDAVKGYVDTNSGWTDYLLTDQIIFSHRINTLTPQNFHEDLHAHNYYELVIFAGGEDMQYIADGQYLSVKPGTVILTKPMAIHMFRPLAPVCYDRYILYFKPSLDIFSQKEILNFTKIGNNQNTFFYFPDSESVCEYAKMAEQELMNINSPYASAKALLSLCNLFVTLSDNEIKNTDIITSNVPDYLYEIKKYIDEEFININSTLNLTDKFYYSREYITRGFRQYFNTPLYEYILRRKLVYCCALLREGMSVEKSATMSGFKNMSSFTRLFKKFNGCTPSEYRAKSLH